MKKRTFQVGPDQFSHFFQFSNNETLRLGVSLHQVSECLNSLKPFVIADFVVISSYF